MKKLIPQDFSFDELKNVIMDLKSQEDKKNFYMMIGVIVAVLTIATLGIVWIVKKKMDENYEDWECDDWDEDWDEESELDCCCSDKDVDHSVKVEKL